MVWSPRTTPDKPGFTRTTGANDAPDQGFRASDAADPSEPRHNLDAPFGMDPPRRRSSDASRPFGAR
jgi:hypothetical protein